MIHTTIGIYLDRSYKINGVCSENLAEYIEYNILNRPGRALIVDNKVIYAGYYKTFKKVKELLNEIKSTKLDKDTKPYIYRGIRKRITKST